MSYVLDASISVAWVHPWETTPSIDRVFDEVLASHAWVPSLWHLEVANVFQMNIKRKQYQAAVRDKYIALLLKLPLSVDPFTDAFAWTNTLALAQRHTLTVYDAAYLELALRRGLPLATLDSALRDAARREGVQVFGF